MFAQCVYGATSLNAAHYGGLGKFIKDSLQPRIGESSFKMKSDYFAKYAESDGAR